MGGSAHAGFRPPVRKGGSAGYQPALAPSGASRSTPAACAPSVLALIAVCLLCYGNTLNCYFFCDDYTFLHYMHLACQGQYNVLLDSFTTPMTALQPFLSCYRPLPFIIMFVQYLIAGTNPFWYHLTNLSLHCANATLVFLVGKRLLRDKIANVDGVAFFGAALFAAYPLIVETVNAPVNVVTLSCSTLALLSVLAFVTWRQSGKQSAILTSVVASGLALLCKEQAAILAPLFTTAVAFRFIDDSKGSRRETGTGIAWYWVLLAVYLGVRLAVLGPAFGGYHGPSGDWLVYGWKDRLLSAWPFTCVFPLNPAVFPPNTFLTGLLAALYIAAAGIGLAKLVPSQAPESQKARVGSAAFLVVFFACTFFVALPVWYLENSLAGARHFYLAAAPLALLFAFGTYNRRYEKLWTAVCVALLGCFMAISMQNNTAWINAGNEALHFKAAVDKEVNALNDGASLVIVNPPQKRQGVYLFSSSDMLRAAFRTPIVSHDISGKVETLSPWVILNHDLYSLARLRQLSREPQRRLVCWDADALALKPFNAASGNGLLNMPLEPVSQHLDQSHQVSTAEFLCTTRDALQQCAFIECRLRCHKLPGVPAGTVPAISLWWQTQQDPSYSDGHAFYLPVMDDGQPHTYNFPVSSSSRWSLSHPNGRIRICLPSPNFANELTVVKLCGWRYMAPDLTVMRAGRPRFSAEIGHDGIVICNSDPLEVQIDGGDLPHASRIIVEISRRNGLLEVGVPNGPHNYQSPLRAKEIVVPGLSGTVKLSSADFGEPGLYEIEAAAEDDNGKVCGFFCDPIFVDVQR